MSNDDKLYNCFSRTWWERTDKGLEPCMGDKEYHEDGEEWNANNDEGELSLKCEFEEA